MSKIIVFTQTHNSQNTIRRCIESVLGQSYSNIVYYIADNNSTDETKKIIQKYAGKDKRVVPVFSNNNDNWQIYELLPEILREHGTDGYFISLDSDDAYAPFAFEKLVKFAEDHGLDIGACESVCIDIKTNTDVSKTKLDGNIMVDSENAENLFRYYFKYIRDSWGKLISLKLFKGMDYKAFDKTVLSGSVSPLAFEAHKKSRNFGILAERLYFYYIYPNSFERSFANKRLTTPWLYAYYRDYLISKFGRLSDENAQFLCGSYLNAVKHKLSVILGSAVDGKDKLKALHYMLSADITCELFSIRYLQTEKKAYIDEIRCWLEKESLLDGPESEKLNNEILKVMKNLEKSWPQ